MGLTKRRKVELSQDTKDVCKHPGDIAGMCLKCGQKVDDDDGLSRVRLRYIHKKLRVSNGEMLRLRDSDSQNLLRRKKLYLVLDLDHTLLNSSATADITSSEEEFLNGAFPDTLFRLSRIQTITKLRPFVHTFLKEASNLFEMCIYTMAARAYALEMAKLLDPEDIYFNSRIISRADCTEKNRKGLDVVLGQESAAIIIDDSVKVWGKHRKNLITIDRYQFFASSCKKDCKSLTEVRCDERESDGALATVLEILKRVHTLFFDEECKDNLEDRDVRNVLATILSEKNAV